METSLAVGLQRITLAYHFLSDSFPDQAARSRQSEIERRKRSIRNKKAAPGHVPGAALDARGVTRFGITSSSAVW
jgi:hypothetical protein